MKSKSGLRKIIIGSSIALGTAFIGLVVVAKKKKASSMLKRQH